jgi:N-acetylglucosaminyldiphosphoundecaprenol N-acetyl-beta-D-mannosaminyltransferase
VTLEETLGEIADHIARRHPAYFITANLDFAAKASKDAELHRIFLEADLVLCDGTPIVWLSRLTGERLCERVAGSDLIPLLAGRAAANGWRLFLLGGDPKSLQAATHNLRNQHPGIIIAGSYSPPFAPLDEMDHDEITKRIRNCAPDILLVAFGCPKQEKWIYRHYRDLGVPCSIGVGATIDFIAGKVRRAPRWIGALGLEWVFRMLQEPGRLAGRYWEDILFLISQILKDRNSTLRNIKDQGAVSSESTFRDGFEIIHWNGPLVSGTFSKFTPPSRNHPYVIDLSGVTNVDSRGLGHLISALKCGSATDNQGHLACPSKKIMKALDSSNLTRILPIYKTIDEAVMDYRQKNGLLEERIAARE